MEHDINIDQIEKLKKENNDLGNKNISLIKELNDLKRNQNNFIENNILDKKSKCLNNQISYLKAKLKNYNNLEIYIKLYLENKNCVQSEKEEFFIRKIKEELDYIEQKPKSLRKSFQTNNNYLVLYLSWIVKTIVQLHKLINNKIALKEEEKQPEKNKKEAKKEEEEKIEKK
jgi:26S proteasome regulatory subunit N8